VRFSLVVAATAMLLGLAAPAPAVAGCGGVRTGEPPRHKGAGLPPIAIGDSTMLLALPNLTRRGFTVNAHGCRQFPEARALLARLARAHRLPHLVVVALGADGSVTAADVRATLRILGAGRMLVLVTPRELGGGSGSDAAIVRDAARSHAARVEVLDWVAESAGHGGWFQPDGLHLTFTGAAAFARVLARALPLAAAQPSPLVLTADSATGRRVRITLLPRWRVLRRALHTGIVRTPGRCGYRITFTAATTPATQGTALPPGAAIGHSGKTPGAGTWLTWRVLGTPLIGGAWVTPPAPDGSVAVIAAHGVVAADCPIDLARRAQTALATVLRRARPV
jgi:hypothetical protein